MARVTLLTYRTLPGGRGLDGHHPIAFSVPADWLDQWLERTYAGCDLAHIAGFLDAYTYDDALACVTQAKADGVFRYATLSA